ncbi:MAG TPA: DUF374 domain-containing protein [Roseiarcus sp.]|nr:DUF374 domain-containing protein [Roseiarcus sp.]
MNREGGGGGFIEEAMGLALAQYLRLVKRLNRFVVEPSDLDASLGAHLPVITAMWHGQHLMISFARPSQMTRVCAMVSRHRDAGLQAAALRRLNVEPVRGSGARGDKVREKGGAKALITLRQKLDGGASIAMTADVPKVARVAGMGVVTLARISGRPIVPVAVVTSRRLDFKSWDRASIGLPFGRGAIVVGAPVYVAAEASQAQREAARLAVQEGLDAAHARAYALVGATDPGAGLRTAPGAGLRRQ